MGLTLTEVLGLENESEKVLLKTECGRLFRMYRRVDGFSGGTVVLQTIKARGEICGEVVCVEEERERHCQDLDEDGAYYNIPRSLAFFDIHTMFGELSMTWYGMGVDGYEDVHFCEIFEAQV